MPNEFIDVSCEPTSVKSGEKTKVTVTFTTASVPTLTIVCGSEFSIKRRPSALTRKGTSITETFDLAIDRTGAKEPESCMLKFSMLGGRFTRFVKVT